MSQAGAVASAAGEAESVGPGGPPQGVFDDDGPSSAPAESQSNLAGSFLAGKRGGQPAPRQGPAAAPARGGAAPAPEHEQDAPAEDDDPTAKAYTQPDDMEADAAPASETAEAAPKADTSLETFAKIFGLDAAKVTGATKDAIVSDVQAVLARGAAQPGSQPAAPIAGPRPASPQSQSPAAAPAASADLAPLSSDELNALAEFGPVNKALGERFNKLAERLAKAPEASPDTEALKTQLAEMDRRLTVEVAWNTTVQPFVAGFCSKMAKQGLPAVPAHEMRPLANDAQKYQWLKADVDPQTNRPRGPVLTDDQAMQAVYMAKYGTQVQETAQNARAAGERSVVNKLQAKQRKFDLGGGAGAIGGVPRAQSADDAILDASRSYRRGMNQRQ